MLLTNIGCLAMVENSKNSTGQVRGADMDSISSITDAWLLTRGDHIVDYGEMASLPEMDEERIDVQGGYVLPSWCDSHTHLVYAAPREAEFVAKIQGRSYAEIAAAGGGILNSAKALAAMEEDELYEQSLARLHALMALGTGAIEIKSGYGLSTDAELKMLRVIRRLREQDLIPVKATFLGAHAFPQNYANDHGAYIDLVINEMLPEIRKQGLADYIDVFCESGFFSPEDTDRILKAGAAAGLKSKVHANQLNLSQGVQVGVANGALSVDHLETMSDIELAVLKEGHTIPTLLPGAAFFLRMQYPPARRLIEANLPVTVASDFNPGSCPTGNMNLILSLACIHMRMTPNEALQAQTINGAAAMELQHLVGSIAKGKLANLIITKPIPSLSYLPYSFGENNIAKVVVKGKILKA